MPLVWAHSEYIKLRRSLIDGKIFDQPSQTVERYLVKKVAATYFNWRFNNKPRAMPCGKKLRILTIEPALVRWSFDMWQSSQDSDSIDSGCDMQHVDLSTDMLVTGRRIAFTFYWTNHARWEGRDYEVTVE